MVKFGEKIEGWTKFLALPFHKVIRDKEGNIIAAFDPAFMEEAEALQAKIDKGKEK